MQLKRSFKHPVPPRFVVVGADSSTSMPRDVEDLREVLQRYDHRGVDVRIYRLHKVRRFNQSDKQNGRTHGTD